MLKSLPPSLRRALSGPARHVYRSLPPRLRQRLALVLERLRAPPPVPFRRAVVGFGAQGTAYFDTLKSACDASGIGFFTGGSFRPSRRRLHVAADDAPRLLELLATEGFQLGYRLPRDEIREMATIREHWDARTTPAFLIHVTEYASDGPGTPILFCSVIEVDFWSRQSSFSGNSYYAGNLDSAAIRRVAATTLDTLRASETDLDAGTPNLYQVPFDIDVVYTWVNDQDGEWLDRKDHFARLAERAVGQRRAHHAERFRSRDELRYSLRSIEQFAPFVRKIFLVTAGQRPDWLADSPKLTLVDHRDIYRNPDWLPTFNSSGIETQLHHIDGLADKFLDFNDDFFLGRICEPQDFFHANGMLKFFRSDQIAFEPEITEASEEYIKADGNVIALFRRDFEFLARNLMMHVPYPSSRELLYEMEARYQSVFDGAASQRFRSPHDIRPIAFMQYHYGYHTGRAMPSGISHRYLALWKEAIGAQLRGVQASRQYQTFCINDVGLDPAREDKVNRQVNTFLETYFPVPSQFEHTPRPRPPEAAGDRPLSAPDAPPVASPPRSATSGGTEGNRG